MYNSPLTAFVDESGVQAAMSRSHTWVKRGTAFIDPVSMNWGKTLTLIGAIRRAVWCVPVVGRAGTSQRMSTTCPSRIRCQAATGSWTKARQWETERRLFSSARATMCPSAKGNGVWSFNDAWLRTSLEEARRQAPRNGASILDAARELRIRDAHVGPVARQVATGAARLRRCGILSRREMDLNDLLRGQRIDPEHVLVFRHRPHEPQLRKVLPWFAAEALEVFNAYQQTQGPRVEKAMQRASHVAAFIGHEPGKALFVGLYAIGATTPLTRDSYLQIPANVTLKTHGARSGFDKGRSSVLWFDLALTDFYTAWKGKLIMSWPPPERAWWRRAHRNELSVLAILEESAFDEAMPEWYELTITWEELHVLPTCWKSALSQWRGIYVIFDHDDGKSYVGSAYGKDNLLGRWLDYATVGHGGNKHLRKRNPRSFSFSILQRVSPDMEADEIIRLEATWKARLHTRHPDGLNDN